MSADLFRALDDVCAAGVDRVLTSGGEPTSLEGQKAIALLVQKAADRIVVMPGSGIKPENARSLVDRTGVKEVHVGLRSAFASPMLHRNLRVTMGEVAGMEYQRHVVIEEHVRKLCRALGDASESREVGDTAHLK